MALRLQWARVWGRLQNEVGEVEYRTWLRPMTLERARRRRVTVRLPTRFLRDWVRSHYRDRLMALWQGREPAVRRVDISFRRLPGARRPQPDQPARQGSANRAAPRGSPRRTFSRGRDARDSSPRRSIRASPSTASSSASRTNSPMPARGASPSPPPSAGVQPAVPVRRRRSRQDASDARHRLG